MTRLRRFALVAGIVLSLFGLGIVTTPAHAGTGLFYTVVDSDSGIYLRNGTSMAQVDRVTHRYMLYGTRIELICGTWGESVGPRNNQRWHMVYVPSGYAAGQTGWIADRYLDTPNAANKPTPGEPECGSAPQPPPPVTYPGGGSLYYSPYNGPNIIEHYGFMNRSQRWVSSPSPATHTMDVDTWKPGCTAGNAVPNLHGVINGKKITTLAGWSYGRNGPVMFLAAKPPWWQQVNFILLIDPGNKDDYYNGVCDKAFPNKGSMLADWLAQNPNNTLMVLAGALTADYGHPVNGRAHAGVQNKLFNNIRDYPVVNGRNIRTQVVVCNYDGVGHETMWNTYKAKMNNPNRSCPAGVSKSWNP